MLTADTCTVKWAVNGLAMLQSPLLSPAGSLSRAQVQAVQGVFDPRAGMRSLTALSRKRNWEEGDGNEPGKSAAGKGLFLPAVTV